MMPQPDLFSPADDHVASAKIQLLMALRNKGIRTHNILSAIETIPREKFVPRMFETRAYENIALPISAGQTIESPYVIARMMEALEVRERDIVLDVGTGSGYVAAILSKLARRVFTIEQHRELREEAQARFQALDYRTITSLVGDGHRGWKDSAPFDRILVTGAVKAVPSELLEQLTDDGILIAPVGQIGHPQKMLKISRDKWNFHTKILFEGEFDTLIVPAPRHA
jgi:protein-L-isoaspartate(D-aspartate) O-methyltransferase